MRERICELGFEEKVVAVSVYVSGNWCEVSVSGECACVC